MSIIQGSSAIDNLVGTLEKDTISDLGEQDFINGLNGDDILSGHTGKDVLDGGEGNDSLFGGSEDDILSRNNGNDVIFGDSGVDILLGVNPDSPNPGQGEIDTFSGGQGSDFFYLGNQAQAFYNGGVDADFALITDFNPQKYFITIHGNLPFGNANMTLENLGTGVGIFVQNLSFENDLIGFLQNVDLNQLDGRTNFLSLLS